MASLLRRDPARTRGPRRLLTILLALAGITVLVGCYGVDYRYLAVRADGDPAAQRCGAMPFYVNPHGAAAQWQLDAVVDGARQLEQVTGVDWQFRGYTSQRIVTGFDPTAAGGRVLVEFTAFSAPGRPAAYGHPKPNGPGDGYLGGYVYLWPDRVNGLSPAQLRAVVQHELGHVWGLDHPSAPPQQALMSGSPPRRTDYGTGDRVGLRALAAACRRTR